MFGYDCLYLRNDWLTGVKPKVHKDLELTGYFDIDNRSSLLRELNRFSKSSIKTLFFTI